MNNDHTYAKKKHLIISYFNDFYHTVIQVLPNNGSLISDWKIFKQLIEAEKIDFQFVYSHIAKLQQTLSKLQNGGTYANSSLKNNGTGLLDTSNNIDDIDISNISSKHDNITNGILMSNIQAASSNNFHKKGSYEKYQRPQASKTNDVIGLNVSTENSNSKDISYNNIMSKHTPLTISNPSKNIITDNDNNVIPNAIKINPNLSVNYGGSIQHPVDNSRNEDEYFSRKADCLNENSLINESNNTSNPYSISNSTRRRSPTPSNPMHQKQANPIQPMSNIAPNSINNEDHDTSLIKNQRERDRSRGEKQTRLALGIKHGDSASKIASQNPIGELKIGQSSSKAIPTKNNVSIPNTIPLRIVPALDYVSKALNKPYVTITNYSVYTNINVIEVMTRENTFFTGIILHFFLNLIQDKCSKNSLSYLYEKIQSKKIKFINHLKEEKYVQSLLINIKYLTNEKIKKSSTKPLYEMFIDRFFKDIIFQEALIVLIKELLIEFICSLDAKTFSIIFPHEQKNMNRLFSNIRSNMFEPTEELISLVPNIIESNLEVHYMKENKIEIVLYNMNHDVMGINMFKDMKEKKGPITLINTKVNQKSIFQVVFTKEDSIYFNKVFANIGNNSASTNNLLVNKEPNKILNHINKDQNQEIINELNREESKNRIASVNKVNLNICENPNEISRNDTKNNSSIEKISSNNREDLTKIDPNNNNNNNLTPPQSQPRYNHYNNSLTGPDYQIRPNHSPHPRYEKNSSNTTIVDNPSTPTNKIFVQTPSSKTKNIQIQPQNNNNIGSTPSNYNINNTASPLGKANPLQLTKPGYTKAHSIPIQEVNAVFQRNVSGFNKSNFQSKTKDLVSFFDRHTKNLVQYFSKELNNHEPPRPNFPDNSQRPFIEKEKSSNNQNTKPPLDSNSNQIPLISTPNDHNIDPQGNSLACHVVHINENKENSYGRPMLYNGTAQYQVKNDQETSYNKGSYKIVTPINDPISMKSVGTNQISIDQQYIDNNYSSPFTQIDNNTANRYFKNSIESPSHLGANSSARQPFSKPLTSVEFGNQQGRNSPKKMTGYGYHKKSSTQGNLTKELDNLDKALIKPQGGISPTRQRILEEE